MAAKFLMQAQDFTTSELVSWTSDVQDWECVDAPPGGYLSDSVTCAGGGFDTGSDVPDGAYVFDDGSYVVFDDGSYVVAT